jgi:hypothetical protein
MQLQYDHGHDGPDRGKKKKNLPTKGNDPFDI